MAHIGEALVYSALFTNTSGSATDPTTIRFFLREGVDGTELQWTYNGSAVEGTHYPTGMNPITRSAAGTYALRYIARKPERHTGFWHGAGNSVDQTSQVTYFVRHNDIATIDP
jgi:hypothetical protein